MTREGISMNDSSITSARLSKSDLILSLKSEISNRRVIDYTYKDIIHYFMCCSMCRDAKKRRYIQRYRKHHIFSVGKKKLRKELDLVNLMNVGY
jgi:hypothetical protein